MREGIRDKKGQAMGGRRVGTRVEGYKLYFCELLRSALV